MFTEISIENFKAFGKMQRIPLKPITLLYGPNSSGKSSLLQALLMLKQTLEEARNENIVLMPKGSLVDVGGYEEFINEHKPRKAFSIGLSFDPNHLRDMDESYWEEIIDDYYIRCFAWLLQCSTQITFSLNNTNEIIVDRIDCGTNLSTPPMVGYRNFLLDNEVQRIIKKSGDGLKHRMESLLVRDLLNLDNKDYKSEWLRTADVFEDFSEDIKILQERKRSLNITKTEKEKIENQLVWLSHLEQVFKNKSFEQFLEIKNSSYDRFVLLNHCFPNKTMSDHKEIFKNSVENKLMDTLSAEDDSYKGYWLTDFILLCADFLTEYLRRTVYIGPFRMLPERMYQFSGNVPSNVGVAGQHMADILIGRPDIVRKVNEWLNIFEVGYEVEVNKVIRDFYEIALIDKKTFSKASTKDVGFGVSQILPIIVQGILMGNGILCIEQPEIHLHPRLQAELGDFFIHVRNVSGAQEEQRRYGTPQNQLIIETHSEHLILRLLRRIRETTNGELPEGMPPLKPEDVAVIYAKPTEHGTELMELRISEDGDFIDKWPDGFFTERAKELF